MCQSYSQNNQSPTKNIFIDTTDFFDSAHHWYDIDDADKVIFPLPNQKRYASTETINIAENILLFQKSNGGWAKNYDMQAILSEEQKALVLKSKNILNTSFDNGATHSQLKFLARAYLTTKIERYKDAFLHGIEFVLSSQYPNGGFPQFYPDTSGYRKHITFNDGAMIGVMNLLKGVVENKKVFAFTGDSLYAKILTAYNKGIECILNCQIKENETLTAWCQQHDKIDFRPRGARSFEPPAICNGESASIVKFLMSIENPSEIVIHSITSAVNWFEDSKIHGIRIETIEAPETKYIYHTTAYDRIAIEDSNAAPIWARYYELGSHKPIFCNRDGIIVYSLAEVERERRTGYAWYVYDPQEILDLYPEWKSKWLKN